MKCPKCGGYMLTIDVAIPGMEFYECTECGEEVKVKTDQPERDK